MTICKHLGWFHVRSGTEVALMNPGRLKKIVGELTNPIAQHPSLLLFIGGKRKNQALRELFPNQIKKGRQDGIVDLRIDNTSLYSDYPVLFAESDPSATTIPPLSAFCHETESFPVGWAKAATISNVYDILHARLICPFSDVLCIFADDFPNLESVVDRLKAWAIAGGGFDSPERVRPSVVVVQRGLEASASPTYDLLELEEVRLSLDTRVLRKFYSTIKILHLADEQISPLARFRRLKELLWRQMDEMRNARSRNRCLYSAVHLEKFFQMAISHTASSILRPFDFITASRLGNEVDVDHASHLTTFLRLGKHHQIADDTVAAFVASSMLLDAYPPKMHRFRPERIYDVIYRPACLESLAGLVEERLQPRGRAEKWAKDQEQSIKRHLVTLFLEMISSGKSAARMHRENSSCLSIPWSHLRCNGTCLWCLRRRPENPLSCGHAICDVCVRIYGEEMPITECQYHITACLLCQTGHRTVRLKPFSAGERILAVDGGGTHGVIPLDILATIQSIMGTELQLQDLFDIAFGTSVGGLIVCILFLRNMPITRCVQVFDTLARKLFERPRGTTGIIKRLRLFLRGWYKDGHYDADALEDLLKQYLGKNDRMFGYHPTVHGPKVGVVAATIGNASPVIFTNYNGSSTGKEKCGYTHIRPENIEDEPCIWEAGRGTSAAPVLYRSAQIKASGPVQDGGMSGHNNPVRIALSERLRNDRALEAPDIVVSLGTGTQKASPSPRATDFRHVILDGYVPRLWRSYMSSFNGQRIWDELMNSLDVRNRESYIRLNSVLPTDEPAIDNVDRMAEMRDSVHVPPMLQDCKKTLYRLLVSAFYFELRSIPEYVRDGRYHCRGTIRCRLPGTAVFKLLRQCTTSNLAFTNDVETLGYCEGNLDLCSLCHRFQKNVEFFIRHPSELVTIYLQSVTQGRRKISAFPQKMQWFQTQQKLDAPFGTAHHWDLHYRACKSCIPNSALKRPTSDDQERLQTRKKVRR